MELWNDILIIVLEALIPVAIIAIGLLLRNFLKKKGASEQTLAYIDLAYSYLSRAVTSTNQTWVDALKKANGKLTEEEQKIAREKTIETFKEMLTAEMNLAIETVYGSLEKWINTNLESAVGEIKNLK